MAKTPQTKVDTSDTPVYQDRLGAFGGSMTEVAGITVLKAGLIDLDATYLIQMGLFLIVFILLRQFFFLPYADMLRRRSTATVGLETRGKEQLRKAMDIEAETAQRLAKTREEAMALRKSLAQEGVKIRDDIVAKEREAMQKRLDNAIAELDEQKAKFRQASPAAIAALAKVIEAQINKVEAKA